MSDARADHTELPLFRRLAVGRPSRLAALQLEPQSVVAETAEVADRHELRLSADTPLRLRTRVVGLFLFLPLLAQLGFDQAVRQAGYPGSSMIPAEAAILSLLALKLLRKERKSHINDLNFEPAVGLFAGLNVLPKKSFATDYSYRSDRDHQTRLLSAWVQQLSPVLLPQAHAFSLDFHPIAYRGEHAVLENHYIPLRGQATPSVQSFFAQEHDNQIFCYANANVTHAEQALEVIRFVEFWYDLTGTNPQWLYFDSKLTTYAQLSCLNERGVYFVTVRRRGAQLLKQLHQRPASDWVQATIDIPKRRHKRIRYVEDSVTLRGYKGTLRQIAVKSMGREQPTLFLTNHVDASARELITQYARRNRIEDGLGTNVNFFHLDCLSSEVRLNVDFDATLTVIAHGCYRWLARQLKGFDNAKAKQVARKFIETSGEITVIPHHTLQITFDRRSHNPILREAALDEQCPPIPWLDNYRVKFLYK